jgi:hypothetical protein
MITDDSGHYQPSRWQTNQVIRTLSAAGIDMTGVMIERTAQ